MAKTDLALMLNNEQGALAAIAPKYVSVSRMTNLTLQAISRDSKIGNCTPVSIVKFCKTCAEWGTDQIGKGGVWPVAFKTELVAIPDWRFIIQKAKDAKVIKHAFGEVVHQNDQFSASRGMYPNLEHNIAPSNRGEIVGFYCIIILPDDTRDFAYMTVEEVQAIKSRAPAGNKGPWVTDFAQMGVKTVIKRGLKAFEGASPELSMIMDADNRAMGYIDAEVVERAPIAMPTQIAAPAPQQTPSRRPAAPQQTQTAAPTGDTIEGVIAKVFHKKSRSDAKKPWERWGVVIGESTYGTFDAKHGALAVECEKEGCTVIITASADGDYMNLTSIEKKPAPAAEQAQAPEQTEDDGSVPGGPPEDAEGGIDELPFTE